MTPELCTYGAAIVKHQAHVIPKTELMRGNPFASAFLQTQENQPYQPHISERGKDLKSIAEPAAKSTGRLADHDIYIISIPICHFTWSREGEKSCAVGIISLIFQGGWPDTFMVHHLASEKAKFNHSESALVSREASSPTFQHPLKSEPKIQAVCGRQTSHKWSEQHTWSSSLLLRLLNIPSRIRHL